MAIEDLYISVIYDSTDISKEINEDIVRFEYIDRVQGASDEISITVEDTSGKWKDNWRPEKGAKLTVNIGFESAKLFAGVFDVDKVEASGPPDEVIIRAIATGISSAIRTKLSEAYENQTLAEVISIVAKRNGLKILGEIEDIKIERATQNRETDLEFLQRISEKYGHVFSIRNEQLIFTTIYELEGSDAVLDLDITECAKYEFDDDSINTYQAAVAKYIKPEERRLIEFQSSDENLNKRVDKLEIRVRAENEQQSESITKAALYESNSLMITGLIDTSGNSSIVAGINFNATGFGGFSGKYHIKTSRHIISKDEGYKTAVNIKKIADISDDQKTPRTINFTT